MNYLFLNACIVGTMTKNINPLMRRLLEPFSGTKGVDINYGIDINYVNFVLVVNVEISVQRHLSDL